MSDSPSLNIEEILRESMDNFEKALKFAIDANARAIGYWNNLVGRLAPAAR